MESALERDDVRSIIEGLFAINANLVDIRDHLRVIRQLLGEEPNGEEEEEEVQ